MAIMTRLKVIETILKLHSLVSVSQYQSISENPEVLAMGNRNF